jgi:tetratricopeptide (TPR) repeat protein
LAAQEFEATLEYNSQLMEGYTGLGEVYTATGKYREAVAAYHQALGLAKKICPKGERYLAQGEYLQAIAEYRFALGLEMEILVPEIEKGKLLHLPSKDEAERRRAERYLLRIPVDVREGPGSYLWGTTLNVSRYGFLLETSQELAVGSQVEIITPMVEDRHKIAIPARVVRLERKMPSGESRLGMEVSAKEEDILGWEKFIVA